MTKKHFYYFLYLFILFLLQAAAIKVWSGSAYIIPQLILLFVVIFALNHSLPETLWFSFGAGGLLELYSGQFFGSQIVSLVVTGLMVYFITRHLTTQELAVPMVISLVVLATGLFGLWIFLYQGLVGFLGIAPVAALKMFYSFQLIWTAILNLLFVYPVQFIFRLLPR